MIVYAAQLGGACGLAGHGRLCTPTFKFEMPQCFADIFVDLFPHMLKYLDCEAVRKIGSLNSEFRNRSYRTLAMAESSEMSGRLFCKLEGKDSSAGEVTTYHLIKACVQDLFQLCKSMQYAEAGNTVL